MKKNELISKTPEELMDIYVNGHPEDACLAFDEIYHRYANRIYIYAIKRLNIKTDAEDAIQKIFMKLHTSKHLYNSKFKFEQWIFVIARTCIYDLLRKKVSDVKKIEELFKQQEYSLPINEEDKIELKDLTNLTSEQKQLLEFKYLDELSYKEIAKIVNKSEASLRKIVSRLVLKLKNGGAYES